VKILFIGGTGNISASCTELAHRTGHEVTLLTRGLTRDTDMPEGVRLLLADAHDPRAVQEAADTGSFDVIVQWIGYTPEDIARDIRALAGKTSQYIFISSAAAYAKPPPHYIVTENTPLANPYWQYARDKIACEELLLSTHRESGFPVTIVRPSLTYGVTRLPIWVGSWGTPYTIVDRMRRGKKVVVPGDGTAVWTITHSTDFAKGLVGLCGLREAVGEAFHITSDEALAWNQIYAQIAEAGGGRLDIVHMATDFIVAASPKDEGTLLGDKIYSTVFDNSKLKRFVPGFSASTPLRVGARETLRWFDADERRRKVDDEANRRWDRIIAAYEAAQARS
jgi:nucleoside-diphosphate-sugar epimerase